FRSGTLLLDHHSPPGRHAPSFESPAGRIKLHAHIDGSTLTEAEVALGLAGRVVTVKALPAPDGDRLVGEQAARLAGLVHANLRAGGAGVAALADELHPQPVVVGYAIQKHRQRPALIVDAAAGHHQIEPAIAIDVAEAQSVVHVAVGEIRQPPAVVDVLERPVAGAAQHVQEAAAVAEKVGNAVVVEVHDDRAAPAVAPVRMRLGQCPLQPAHRAGLAREPALAVVEVNDDLPLFHADQVEVAVAVEVADAVDTAFLAQAALTRHVDPAQRTDAAKDLAPRGGAKLRLPGDQLELSVAVEIDRDRAGAAQPGGDNGARRGAEGPVALAQGNGDVGFAAAGDDIDDAVPVDVGRGTGADVRKIGLDELRLAEDQPVPRRGGVVQRAAAIVPGDG